MCVARLGSLAMQGPSKMAAPSARHEQICVGALPTARPLSAAGKRCKGSSGTKFLSSPRGAKDGKVLIFLVAASPATEGGRKGQAGVSVVSPGPVSAQHSRVFGHERHRPEGSRLCIRVSKDTTSARVPPDSRQRAAQAIISAASRCQRRGDGSLTGIPYKGQSV